MKRLDHPHHIKRGSKLFARARLKQILLISNPISLLLILASCALTKITIPSLAQDTDLPEAKPPTQAEQSASASAFHQYEEKYKTAPLPPRTERSIFPKNNGNGSETLLQTNSETDDVLKDVVISTSEIISEAEGNSSKQSALSPIPERIHPDTKYTDNQRSQSTSWSPYTEQPLSGWVASDTKSLAEPDWDLSESNRTTDRRQPNSRFLLRILVISLFALVSGSLVLVYTIKFCICKRRKRQLRILSHRRDLVADLSSSSNPSALPALQLAHCPEPPIRTQSLATRSPSSVWSSVCSQAASLPLDYSFYQRLAIAERLALQQHFTTLSNSNNNSSLPPYSNTELLGIPGPATCTCFPSSLDFNGTATLCPPPAYSDIFGQAELAQQQQQHQAILQNATLINSAASNSESSNNQDCSISPSISSQVQASQSYSVSLNPNPNQKNLLVKLNLNKTKLLSAEDLVLLSKLIDVPIVVQQQEQEQQQAVAQVTCDETSGTLEELNEEETEEEVTSNYNS